MPENTAEGDPAVFLYAMKNTKPLRLAITRDCKKYMSFLWHPRIDKMVRGGKLNSSKPEGFHLGV